MSTLPRDWRLQQRNHNFEKNQSQLEAFHLNAFLYVLKKHLCEEINERKIPLVLYIRLEYKQIFIVVVIRYDD